MSPGTAAALNVALPLPERLLQYSRYLTLVAAELEALEQRDLARLRETAEQRAELEREMRPTPETDDDGVEPPPPPPPPLELAALLDEGLRLLVQSAEADRLNRDRWSTLEEDALKAMHGVRLTSLRGGHYREFASLDARLDVRF